MQEAVFDYNIDCFREVRFINELPIVFVPTNLHWWPPTVQIYSALKPRIEKLHKADAQFPSVLVSFWQIDCADTTAVELLVFSSQISEFPRR